MVSHSVERFFQIAAAAAEKSSMLYPLGACVVSGGKVISTGYNSERSQINLSCRGINVDERMRTSNGKFSCASTHAEIAALSRLMSIRRGMLLPRRFEGPSRKQCERGPSKVSRKAATKNGGFGPVCSTIGIRHGRTSKLSKCKTM